jgi:hypothetical protein
MTKVISSLLRYDPAERCSAHWIVEESEWLKGVDQEDQSLEDILFPRK